MLALEVKVARLCTLERWIIKCEFWIQQASTPVERAMWKEELERAKKSYAASLIVATLSALCDVRLTDEYRKGRDIENEEARQKLVASSGHCHAFVTPCFLADGNHDSVGESDYPFGYRHYRRAFEALKKGKT
jgi:hypothetical protein